MLTKNFTLKNPVIKNLLSALAIAGLGFALLNLAFLFFALVGGVMMFLFAPGSPEEVQPWLGPATFAVAAVLIAIFTWLVFRSGWPIFVKATYLVVPTAIVLALCGMIFYRWPVIGYSIGTLLVLITLYFFYQTKQPWQYCFAIILIGLALAFFSLSGGEI